ncbi:MAG TPA: lipocalin, partial [Marinobacter adhaerens]|nr:lipocalin [Marinobacter adhaerens]
RDYLWFLSRTPEVSEEAIEAFRRRAKAEGFDLEELIIVEQGKNRS